MQVKTYRKIKKINITIFFFIVLISLSFLGCSKDYVTVKIEGNTMFPSLRDSDKIFIEKPVEVVKREEIVVFQYPKNIEKLLIKRVIGLPNETVEIRNGKVFINNNEIDEPYLDQMLNQAKVSFPPTLVPKDSYFVMGDNRDNSSDSRSWGTVPNELIVGKYVYTYSSSK